MAFFGNLTEVGGKERQAKLQMQNSVLLVSDSLRADQLLVQIHRRDKKFLRCFTWFMEIKSPQ